MARRARPRKETPPPQIPKEAKNATTNGAAATRKTDTVEWLATQMHSTSDLDRVRVLFENMTPLAKPELYQVGKARTILRTDVHKGVAYERFGPDAWEAPYVIIRATVNSKANAEKVFHYHLGEELLTPIDGAVTYEYHWLRGEQKEVVERGSLLRMNCQLPHRNWASEQDTHVWMAVRPETRSTASFGMETTPNVVEKLSQSISGTDVKNPGKFALVALGLQPLLKIARHRAGLTIDKLAVLCEISQSSASRLEDLKTSNLSIPTLEKIAEKLDLDLSRVFPSFSWDHLRAKLDGSLRPAAPLKSTIPPTRHYLHPIQWQLKAGERIEEVVYHKKPEEQEHGHPSRLEWPKLGADSMHSLIVLAGRLLVDIGDQDNPQSIALNTPGVLHLRNNPTFSMQALTACSVLHIVYSSVCVCDLIKESRS